MNRFVTPDEAAAHFMPIVQAAADRLAITPGEQFGVAFDAPDGHVDSATAAAIAAPWADEIDAWGLRRAYRSILPSRVRSGRERLGE